MHRRNDFEYLHHEKRKGKCIFYCNRIFLIAFILLTWLPRGATAQQTAKSIRIDLRAASTADCRKALEDAIKALDSVEKVESANLEKVEELVRISMENDVLVLKYRETEQRLLAQLKALDSLEPLNEGDRGEFETRDEFVHRQNDRTKKIQELNEHRKQLQNQLNLAQIGLKREIDRAKHAARQSATGKFPRVTYELLLSGKLGRLDIDQMGIHFPQVTPICSIGAWKTIRGR